MEKINNDDNNTSNVPYVVKMDSGNWLISDQYGSTRPWDVYDARKGDVLVVGDEKKVILLFNAYGGDEEYPIDAFCALFEDGTFHAECRLPHENTRPSTESERKKLFKAINNNGYVLTENMSLCRKTDKNSSKFNPGDWITNDGYKVETTQN